MDLDLEAMTVEELEAHIEALSEQREKIRQLAKKASQIRDEKVEKDKPKKDEQVIGLG